MDKINSGASHIITEIPNTEMKNVRNTKESEADKINSGSPESAIDIITWTARNTRDNQMS